MQNLADFFSELKRRRIFRVLVAYTAVAFVIIQVMDICSPALRLLDWILTFVIVLVGIGFLVVMSLAWAFDITDKGVVKTPPKEEATETKESHHFVIGNKALAIIAVSGYIGVLGAFEGRYMAASSEALRIYAFQASAWLVALVATVLLAPKTNSKLRFNGLMLLCIFATQVISIFLIILPWLSGSPETSLALLLPWMLPGMLTATVVQYLVTASYLVLSYRFDLYDKRLRSWLKLADNT
jgi:hypothetical protein